VGFWEGSERLESKLDGLHSGGFWRENIGLASPASPGGVPCCFKAWRAAWSLRKDGFTIEGC
jgi:hypothetical protein